MSNMPAIDKQKYSLYLKIKTVAKIDHVAKNSNMSRNEVAQVYLERATESVVLSADELQAVTDRIKANLEARNAK